MREAGERLGWQKVKRGKRGDERGERERGGERGRERE